MKKIKLNTGKLKLKKESIGNLLSKETMGQVMGGLAAPSVPYANCTVGCASVAPQCGIGQYTIGCPPSADCFENTQRINCLTNQAYKLSCIGTCI